MRMACTNFVPGIKPNECPTLLQSSLPFSPPIKKAEPRYRLCRVWIFVFTLKVSLAGINVSFVSVVVEIVNESTPGEINYPMVK